MINNTKKETLLLVDGNALVHRGFHAIPYLSTKTGEPTNGVYGFALLLLNALKELRPDYAVVCFDLPKPTFRDKLFEEYKAKRVAAPDELYQQIPRVKDMVQAFNIPIFEKVGYEADDIIGTLAKQGDKKNLQVIILTGDYDTLQLVNHNIKVFAPKKGLSETTIYGKKEVEEKYSLKTSQLIDYKALRGDPSDNIPGVKGVGDKITVELLQKFVSLDRLYKYLEDHKDGGTEIKPRIAKLLLEYKDDAKLSRELAKIVCDVPVELNLESAALTDFDEADVVKIFQELEFKTLLDKLPKSTRSHQKNLGEKSGKSKSNYLLIDTPKKLEKFIAELSKQKALALDTETTSERPMAAELVGAGFAWEQGQAYYLPKNFVLHKQVASVLEDQTVLKIGHNIKYDILVLKQAGIMVRGKLFDTMVAAYLLNPGARAFSLDALAFSEFGYRMQPIEELIGTGTKSISMASVDPEKVALYCGEDVDFTWRLHQRLEKELGQKKLLPIFEDIEMPLIRVLMEMEFSGIKLNEKILYKLSQEAVKEIKKIEQKIYNLAGKEFNIGSPIQLKEILFDQLEISTEGIRKGKAAYSTAATELEKLRNQHPIIDLISDWREVTKLKNTYLNALPSLADKKTGRIHTSFNQTIAATGRLSSSDPNLQNIPARTPLGRKVRGAFVAKKNYKILSLDYSQIELRLAAHLSGDEKMLAVFKSGGDIHTATAMEIFEVFDPEKVTADERRKAKVINFGILYGLSAYGLTSRIPEVSRGEAEEFIVKYREAYPGLMRFLEEVIRTTKDKGYVVNELGRIRNLLEINSSQFQVRSAAERAAINMPLQSLAADIIKMAMNQLYKEGLVADPNCRLLLQVHDELVFEVAENQVRQHAEQIAKTMEKVYKLKIPLVVEAKVGQDWEKMDRLVLT